MEEAQKLRSIIDRVTPRAEPLVKIEKKKPHSAEPLVKKIKKKKPHSAEPLVKVEKKKPVPDAEPLVEVEKKKRRTLVRNVSAASGVSVDSTGVPKMFAEIGMDEEGEEEGEEEEEEGDVEGEYLLVEGEEEGE